MLVHLINGPRLRGAERFALELVESIAQRGVRQLVIALRGLEVQTQAIPGCEVVTAPEGQLARLRWLRSRMLSVPNAVVLCHGQGPQKEAVIALLGSSATRPFLAVKQIGMLMHWVKSHVGPRIRFNRWLMARTNLSICLGPRQADEVHRLLGMPEARVVQIPNGRRRPPNMPSNIVRDRREILVVGALSPEKSPELALDVFRAVRDSVPDGRLTFVGDGPLRRSLEDRAKRSLPSGSVTFLGHVDNVWPLYLRAGLVILCSQTEGVPGTVVEATIAGAPTVAWEVGDVAEVLRDGQNGRLTPFGDIAALTAAARDLVADQAGWERICLSTSLLGATMSFDRITDAYLSVLRLDK